MMQITTSLSLSSYENMGVKGVESLTGGEEVSGRKSVTSLSLLNSQNFLGIRKIQYVRKANQIILNSTLRIYILKRGSPQGVDPRSVGHAPPRE